MMFIPGRIEVLGKHTDYCGGRSIVCAIDRGFHAEVEPRTDTVVELVDRKTQEAVSFDLSSPAAPARHWLNYAVEVGRRLVSNFVDKPLVGCTIRFTSDLPMAAGLSSSSALMIMVFAALDAVNDLKSTSAYIENIYDDIDLAEYLGCIENGQSYRGLAGSAGVGTFGGGQDHAAIMLGKEGFLSRFAFSPLRLEVELPFPEDLVFVVASSGVAAEKTGAALEKYNRVSRMVSDLTASLGGGPLSQIIEYIGIDEIRQRIRDTRSTFHVDELLGRVEQFYVENYEIIPKVTEMLRVGRYDQIGEFMDLSHRNADGLLGNQIAETNYLQGTAREFGALAASAFGAGFGGSVYAIVGRDEAAGLSTKWMKAYLDRFPQHSSKCEFFVTTPLQIDLS